jgi:hypothetical protein
MRVMPDLDVLCLMSQWEGLPMSIVEAMSVGLPVVATDVGGVSEAVRPGETGLLVPRCRGPGGGGGRPAARPESRLVAMGAAGARAFRGALPPGAVAAQYADVYGKIRGHERRNLRHPDRHPQPAGNPGRHLRPAAREGFGAYPLWIYDDASEDAGAIRAWWRRWPGARLVREERQRGQAHGRNVLLRACGTPYAICLDDDQYFLDEGSLSATFAEPRPAGARRVCPFQCVGPRRMAAWTGPPTCPRAPPPGSWAAACCFTCPRCCRWAATALVGLRLRGARAGPAPVCRGLHLWYDASILVEHNQFHNPGERRDYAEYDYLYARNAVLWRP